MTGDPSWAETYRNVVLGHHRQPRNRGPLDGATHQALGHNVLCGDRIDMRLRIADAQIVDARFEAEAGALTIAAASMLTEMVRGMGLDAARDYAARARTCLEADPDQPLDPDLGELAALAGVRAYPSRRRAVTLPIAALQAALTGEKETSTESA